MNPTTDSRKLRSAKAPLLFLVLLSLLLVPGGCKTYDVFSVQTSDLSEKSGSAPPEIGIGFFETTGFNSGDNVRRNLYDSMKFALKERSFPVTSEEEMLALLGQTGLPSDRELKPDEVLQFSSSYGGKYFLQGRLDQKKTEDFTKDFIQAMLHVNIYEVKTGKEVGVVKVFARDLKYLSPKQLLQMTRLFTEEMEKLGIRGR